MFSHSKVQIAPTVAAGLKISGAIKLQTSSVGASQIG
jgi:hypothetical protein